MKNVTITNGQIATRATCVVVALSIASYVIVNKVDFGKSPHSAVTGLSLQAPAASSELFIPHGMRGPFYDADDCKNTASHHVYIGMPVTQVLCQTGEPKSVNKSTNQYGTHAQYVFEGTAGERWYLYVDKGSISSWQESWTK